MDEKGHAFQNVNRMSCGGSLKESGIQLSRGDLFFKFVRIDNAVFIA